MPSESIVVQIVTVPPRVCAMLHVANDSYSKFNSSREQCEIANYVKTDSSGSQRWINAWWSIFLLSRAYTICWYINNLRSFFVRVCVQGKKSNILYGWGGWGLKLSPNAVQGAQGYHSTCDKLHSWCSKVINLWFASMTQFKEICTHTKQSIQSKLVTLSNTNINIKDPYRAKRCTS